jgi:hypothetical protein
LIDLPDGTEVRAEGFNPKTGDLRKAFASLLAFLSACGDGYQYEMTGGKSDNVGLFPEPVPEWAYRFSSELQTTELELTENP